MTVPFLYALVGVTLFTIGLYGLLAHPHLLRKIIGFNIMGSGISLLLIGWGWRPPPLPPDPVPHALVLTGIVVAVSATAFGLALACRLYVETGQTALPDDASEESS